MQDIVYKLVPKMPAEEQKRRKAFLSKYRINDSKLLDLGVQAVVTNTEPDKSFSDNEECCASEDDVCSAQ
jgi:hypothetical protein